jgi:glycosyltransferase involved in cell wall biosynthesis
MSPRGRIAFFNEYVFPVLVPTDVPFAGGSETQIARLATGLRDRGFEITIVTCDFGQPAEMQVDGMRVLKTFARHHGPPGLRFFHPRLTRTWSALQRADAELYYVKGSGLTPGLAFDAARSRRAASIIHCSHDEGCTWRGVAAMNPRDRWWYMRALRGADTLVAQTEWQRSHFQSEFGLASQVLPNVVDIPARPVDPGQTGVVLWLGTYKEAKRPERFIQLAGEFPEQRFVMTGVIPPPPLSQAHWLAARAAAREHPNLEVHGFLPHASVAELLSRAALLVHTSEAEGFSNVLLEAWALGLPTVAFVDPDGVVERERLGATVCDFPELVMRVRALLADPIARREAGARGRAYVERRHAPALVLDQLATIADGVLARVRERRRAK